MIRLYMIAVDSERQLTPTFHETRKLGSLPSALHVMSLGDALFADPEDLQAILADMDRIVRPPLDQPAPPPVPESPELPIEPEPEGFHEWERPADEHDRQAADDAAPQELDDDPDAWRNNLDF